MPTTSEFIHLLHWAIYIGSFIALAVLLTRFRKWGALWIAILFASQAFFNGCLIVAWENYYRLKEGLTLIPPELLTDRFSSNHTVQTIISLAIAVLAFALFMTCLEFETAKKL